MNRAFVDAEANFLTEGRRKRFRLLQALLLDRHLDSWALGLAFCAAPISIAVCEFLLFGGLAVRVVRCRRGDVRLWFPRISYIWAIWATLEIISWSVSPERGKGTGEIRHLILIAAIFFVMPALNVEQDRLLVWRGIFLSSALCSLFLIGDFTARFLAYRSVKTSPDEVSLFLRSGGLLNHWMVYGTVEILVIAGFLSFWSLYPEERRRWWPVAAIHTLAILLSLTRMVWIIAFLLLGIDLAWRRSKWIWTLPLVPIILYLAAPSPVRMRVNESLRSDYYSDAERVQMARVGWKMIMDRPLTGIGPGRVEALYLNYLKPGEPVPAYHGHLHNNLIQLTAEFGIPVGLAALGTLTALFHDLAKAKKTAISREAQFTCRAGLLGLIGFSLSGLFDYTLGHSLGLILLGLVVLAPLLPNESTVRHGEVHS